ncbi:hypothetical protein AB0E01_10285 [Nocardia vinacea]|uniref:hypothetical protein n=1 Tax=Nocardia vinacea TaxID=96468 RepID=UPI0033F8362F
MSNLDASKSLRDKIQPIFEEVAAMLGAEHPAAVSLQHAATEVAAAASGPRRYGDNRPEG